MGYKMNYEEMRPCIAKVKQKKDWIYLPYDEKSGIFQECKISYDPVSYLDTINRISAKLGAKVSLQPTEKGGRYADPTAIIREINIRKCTERLVRRVLVKRGYPFVQPYTKKEMYMSGLYYEYTEEDPIIECLLQAEKSIYYDSEYFLPPVRFLGIPEERDYDSIIDFGF